MGVNIPGGNFLGGNFPGGNFPGGSLMGGNFPGGNFPGGVFLEPIYFHLEFKILVQIPDSLSDSALALRGNEGDIVKEKL